MKLREYQTKAIVKAEELIRSGVRRFVLQSPTGSGKSLIGSHIMQRAIGKGSHTLFLAHRKELLTQIYDKLTDKEHGCGVPEEYVGIIKSGERKRARPQAFIQIASVQTLKPEQAQQYQIIIIDECHRARAKTYMRILEQAPNAVVLGLTATPKRLDNKGLDAVFDDIVVVAYPSDLINAGFIMQPRVFTVDDAFLPNTRGVKTQGGDFNARDLAVAVNKAELVGSIVEHWLTRAKGLRTLCFCTGITHSKRVCEEFLAKGVRAAHVDGKTPDDERAKTLADLKSGELDVVCNCDLFVEGLDIIEVKCVILARPTKSLTIVLQQVGRALRPWQGVVPIVLDHAGNCRDDRHRFPTLDRDYSLDGNVRPRTGVMRTTTCKVCFAVLPGSPASCPECGAPLRSTDRNPKESEGELVEVTPPNARPHASDTLDHKHAYWNTLWLRAFDQGNSPGWVLHRFKDKYGEDPGNDWRLPERPEKHYSQDEKLTWLKQWTGVAHRNGYRFSWVATKFRMKFGEDPDMLRNGIEKSLSDTAILKLAKTSENTEESVESDIDGDEIVEGVL
jgi:DNA repair protein RadD